MVASRRLRAFRRAILLVFGGLLLLTTTPLAARPVAPEVARPDRAGAAPRPAALTPTAGWRPDVPGAARGPAGCTGGWSVVPSPNIGAGWISISDMAAAGPSDIWGVGSHDAFSSLVEHWDGSAWSIVPSPDVGMLQAVAVVSPTDVWAGGSPMLHWDGSTWTVVPTSSGAIIDGLAALAANDIWAVGSESYYTGQPRIEHWNGTTWSLVPQPAPVGHLNGVAASAPNDVWAVGSGFNQSQMFALHWNGTLWSTVPVPTLADSNLQAITVLAANDAWAVGEWGNYPTFRTLALHWDGSIWSVVTTPNMGQGGVLHGVKALGPNDVWAAGYWTDSFGAPQNLTMHWVGGQWSIVPTPYLGPAYNALGPLVALSSNNVWAGGYYTGSGGQQTLIEHYTGPCATPTPGGTGTPTPTPIPTATPCALTFSDVDQTNPFYPFIRCLACRGIVSGYADGTFRWGNDVTRGQLAKIIAGAANLQNSIPSVQQTFEDVPNTNTFWLFIERLAGIGAISGYACGGPGEPCDPANHPYFRWGAAATRGQIAKITAVTAGWNGPIPTAQQTFEDVPPTNAFWTWIEELASRQVISGYACGGPGEPCGPGNRPYFRWGANTTRGQLSKIAAQAFYPNCQTPTRRGN